MVDSETLPKKLDAAATASTHAGQPGHHVPGAGLELDLAFVVGAARAQDVPAQRQQHQQVDAQQQQPVQQRVADQQRHHHVEEVEDRAEVGPGADDAQHAPLQQPQHRYPGQQHDHLLAQVRPLQAVQHRRRPPPAAARPPRAAPAPAARSRPAGRPRPASWRGAAARRSAAAAARAKAPSSGSSRACAASKSRAKEVSISRLRRSPVATGSSASASRIACHSGGVSIVTRRRSCSATSPTTTDTPFCTCADKALLLRPRSSSLASGSASMVCARSICATSSSRALHQGRRQVGLRAGGLPGGAPHGQLGGVLGRGVGGARDLGAASGSARAP